MLRWCCRAGLILMPRVAKYARKVPLESFLIGPFSSCSDQSIFAFPLRKLSAMSTPPPLYVPIMYRLVLTRTGYTGAEPLTWNIENVPASR